MGITHVRAFLDQKSQLYNNLLTITVELAELLQNNDYDNLDEKWETRLKIIEDINHLDRVYGKDFSPTKAVAEGYESDLVRLKALLQKVQELDTQMNDKLPLLMENLTKEHQQIKVVKKLQNAYGQNAEQNYQVNKIR